MRAFIAFDRSVSFLVTAWKNENGKISCMFSATEEIGAIEHAINVLGRSASKFDEMATFYLKNLLKKLTADA